MAYKSCHGRTTACSTTKKENQNESEYSFSPWWATPGRKSTRLRNATVCRETYGVESLSRRSPYFPFGTPELAKAAIETCGEGKAVILGSHGLVTCGKDLKAAYGLACNMEFVAELQYRAMSIGQPNYLTKEQMDDVMERFKSYGQPNGNKSGY
jgi:ribulose-5-phosphate 4-epimerase/fuculose-1-phosphate aldolase